MSLENKETKYFYTKQIKNYLVQFMYIFSGINVMFGKNDTRDEALIEIPIYYGSKDRVVADIKSEGTTNKPIRLPAMAAYISGIELYPEGRKGIGFERRNPRLKAGGLFPEDIEVVHQYMPIPYKMNVDLCIFASNTDQHLQILEQILVLFDPTLQIQTSDDLFDWTRLSIVELTNINLDENYPSGTDRRIIQSTLNFSMPIQLSVPANIKKDYVAKIMLRIGAVGTLAEDNFDMIAELDAEGFEYNEIMNLNKINGIE